VGRVEALRPDGSGPQVAWAQWTGSAEALMLRRVTAQDCSSRRHLGQFHDDGGHGGGRPYRTGTAAAGWRRQHPDDSCRPLTRSWRPIPANR